jgi:hypothetical protein
MSVITIDIETSEPTLVVVSKKYGTFHVRIDRDVVDKVFRHNWSASKRKNLVYFSSKIRIDEHTQVAVYLHRFIMSAPVGKLVDHINPSDTLDNRTSNLRLATKHENSHNQRPRIGNSSKYKGVSWYKRHSKWQVSIGVNGKRKHLGLYTAEIDAARAYDAAASESFGEFAYLNFPVIAA